MLQFSKVLASLCAGCLCTLTIHQIPALGNVLLPQKLPRFARWM